MLPSKKVATKIIFSGKAVRNSNGALSIALPHKESSIMPTDEYLVTVEGPINSKRSAYNKIVISF